MESKEGAQALVDEDYTHEDAFGAESEVELGFAEQEWESQDMHACSFPSKIGAHPIWLNPSHLPHPQRLACEHCGHPMSFVLQLHASLSHVPHAHYRVLYVFTCRRQHCITRVPNGMRSMCLLRHQLARDTPLYVPTARGDVRAHEHDKDVDDDNDVDDNDVDEEDNDDVQLQCDNELPLCRVCGCWAPSSCSGCTRVRYCGKEHQRMHWSNHHRYECDAAVARQGSARVAFDDVNDAVFKQYYLAMEMEPEAVSQCEVESVPEDDPKASLLHEWEQQGKKAASDDAEARWRRAAASRHKEDPVLLEFQTRCQREPTQVLRYAREGTPLWMYTQGAAGASDVPPCAHCGGPRVFEAQLMPQLLHYLGQHPATGLDWATVALYTCAASCQALDSDGRDAYVDEFVWLQLPSDDF